MFKKNKILLIMFLFCFIFFSQIKVQAYEDNQVVDKNKTWTIKFTGDVGFDDSTKNAINVVDKSGNNVNVTIQLDSSDPKCVKVLPPTEGYIAGENYTLTVGQQAHNKNGKSMKKDRIIHFSAKNDIGNSSGNINNDGIVCGKDGWIYYTNNDKLYKMELDGSNNIKLSNDFAVYINVVGNYIYYINVGAGGEEYKNIIYRMNLDGTSRTILKNDCSSYLNVVGDYIYYVDKSDVYGNGNICRINIDGTNKVKLTEDEAENIIIKDGWIYYTNVTDRYRLYKIRVDGTNNTKLTNDIADYINISDDYIYYKSQDKYNHYEDGVLYRIKTDGTEKKQLTTKNIISINVTNKYIYFTTDDERKLYKMDENILQPILLDDENYHSYLNISDDYIYYKDVFNFYRIKTDGNYKTIID